MTAALSSIDSGVKPETLITDGCFSAEKVSSAAASPFCLLYSSVASFFFAFLFSLFF